MLKTALVVSILLLAGCSGPAAPGQGAESGPPAVVTDPRDLSYLDGSPGAHVHDYWGGRDRIQVLQAHADEHVATSSEGALAGRFQPEEGTIVPQGTGLLEATASWELEDPSSNVPPGLPSDFDVMELWVQTANGTQPRRVAEVEPGVAVRFNVTNDDNDPPHYLLSLWTFELRAVSRDGSAAFNGQSDLAVTAFRTLDLPVFPAHVDRWQGATELVLSDASYTVTQHVTAVSFTLCNGCLPTVVPDPGLVVPHDASRVQVTVTPTTASTPVPLALAYHGADTRAHAEASSQDLPVGPRSYEIAVDGTGDSPYAKQSLWEFVVHMGTPPETNASGAWSGEVHVIVKALKD